MSFPPPPPPPPRPPSNHRPTNSFPPPPTPTQNQNVQQQQRQQVTYPGSSPYQYQAQAAPSAAASQPFSQPPPPASSNSRSMQQVNQGVANMQLRPPPPPSPSFQQQQPPAPVQSMPAPPPAPNAYGAPSPLGQPFAADHPSATHMRPPMPQSTATPTSYQQAQQPPAQPGPAYQPPPRPGQPQWPRTTAAPPTPGPGFRAASPTGQLMQPPPPSPYISQGNFSGSMRPPPPSPNPGQPIHRQPPPSPYPNNNQGNFGSAGMPPPPPRPPLPGPGQAYQQQQYSQPPQQQQQHQQQTQPRIDPSQIPRPPLFLRPNDDRPVPIYSPKTALSQAKNNPPPPSDSRYLVNDDGNASPQLIRSNMYTIPNDRSAWQKLGEVDMGILCTPMALPSEDFVPTYGPQPDDDNTTSNKKRAPLDPQRIPLIQGATTTTADGKKASFVPPPRCLGCQAYVNPFWGTETNACNLCGRRNLNTNFDIRALQKGTVDYAVDGPYITRASPVQPVFLYALDLTCPNLDDYVDMIEQVGIDLARHFQQQPAQQELMEKWQQQENISRNNPDEHTTTVPLLQQQRPRIGLCFVASFGIAVMTRNGPQGTAQASIMSDVTEDPFCHLPLQEWTFDLSSTDGVDTWTRHIQEDLLEGDVLSCLKREAGKKNAHGLDGFELSCGGAALAFCADALSNSGGRCIWISSRRTNFGVGSIRHRGFSPKSRKPPSKEDGTALQLLQKPNNKQDEDAGTFYRKLQEKCSKSRVVIDILIHSNPEHVPHQSLDMATNGELCRATSGKLTWIAAPGMGWKEPFIEELRRPLLCFQGWDAVLKVRCSEGLQVKGFICHPGLSMDGGGLAASPELDLSCVTPQTSISVLLEHKIGGIPKKRNFVFVQSALLYSTPSGQRRVRVSTLALRPSANVADVFLSVDPTAFTTLLLRRTVSDFQELAKGKTATEDLNSLQKATKDKVLEKIVSVLYCYRQHTTAINSPRGQLILPEKMQLLPLFIMCVLKSPLFRPSLGRRLGPGVVVSPTSDERAHFMFQAATIGPASSFLLVHPNVFSIGKPLESNVGEFLVPPGRDNAHSELSHASYHACIQLPPTVNASVTCIQDDGVYLIDTGLVIYLLFGKEVPKEVQEELYHLPISLSMSSASHTVTDYGRQIRRVVWQLRSFCAVNTCGSRSELRPTFPPVIAVSQSLPGHLLFEQDVMSWMVDDPNGGEKDYTDFLCKLHRRIRDKNANQK